jgi:CheY-like chemotaxis protein
MPGMDGYRLCDECKDDEKLRHIPFIFYTAACMDSKDEEFAFSLGADRFLIKPVEPVLLAEMIKDVLNEHAGRSAGVAVQLSDADLHLKKYNEFLVRKLEKKTMDLENEIAERKSLERAVVEIEERETRTGIWSVNSKKHLCQALKSWRRYQT